MTMHAWIGALTLAHQVVYTKQFTRGQKYVGLLSTAMATREDGHNTCNYLTQAHVMASA